MLYAFYYLTVFTAALSFPKLVTIKSLSLLISFNSIFLEWGSNRETILIKIDVINLKSISKLYNSLP